MNNIYVWPQHMFDRYCEENNIDDQNVEDRDEAFISIIGTPDCLKYYLEEPDVTHWFKEEHKNVCNLDFDDLDQNFKWKGHLFKAISPEQCQKLFDFIESNIGKDFRIHCRAGHSRSLAVGYFIRDFYSDYKLCTPDLKTQNHAVYRGLSRKYIETHGFSN